MAVPEKKEEFPEPQMEEPEQPKKNEFNLDKPFESYIDVWRKVILNPRDFFSNMPNTAGYANPLVFLVISSAIGGLFGGLVAGSFLSGLIGIPIAATIGSFIGGGILYLSSLIFADGAKGGYEGTWRIGAYASALSVVTWIPIIGSIISLYGIYISIMGIEQVHSVSTTKATITVLVPIAIIALLTLLVALTIGLTLLPTTGLVR